MASPALGISPYDEDMNEEVRKLGYRSAPESSSSWSPSREELQSRLDKEFNVPQSDFVGEGIRLRAVRPVAIRMSRGEELWFAENDRLDIYAIGESKEAAIQEFKLLLVRFYNHYKSLDTTRALKRAKELKQLFVQRFVEV